MGEVNKYQNYPDPLADNETKMSDAYGLAYAKFIELEWLYGSRTNNRLIQRRSELSYLDSFRTGDVDTSKFKDILNVSQDKAWTAFDWTYFQIIPKFIDIVRDGFPLELFQIQANGIDKQTLTNKERYRETLEIDMLSMPFSQAFSAGMGKDFYPMGFVPESQEELDIHMEDYRQSQEIAMEICLQKIFDINHWDRVHRLIIEDLIVYGIGVCRNIIDPSVGILQRRIDPQNFIYSFDNEMSEDKRGAYYYGEVRILKVEEIQQMSGGKFTDDQLRTMVSGFSGVLGNPRDFRQEELYNYNIEVLEFCFKTTMNEVYKQKYKKISKKEDSWQLHPDSKSKRFAGTFDVWFQGFYITGTQLIYGYQLMEDMVRPKSDINRVLPPYSVYELSTPSLVKRMASIADDLQITRLKIQQHISTSKPAGIAVDVDALAEINLGNGDILRVPDLIDIYNQRGDLIYSGRNLEGDYLQGPPITPLQGGISPELQQLIAYYNQNVKMLYDVTGINPAKDGSAPLDRSLVGTQQLAISASNIAVKRILDGAMSILKRNCEFIISRIQNMSNMGDKYNNAIMSMLGKSNVKIIQEGKDLHMYEYNITIDIAPDSEERQQFRATLDAALNAGLIEVSDRIDLMSTKNLKLANKDLKIRIEKRKRQKRIEELERIDAESKARQREGIAIEREKQRTFQMQIQAEQSKSAFEGEKEAMLLGKKAQFDFLLQQEKHKHELRMKGMEVQSNRELNKFKEDRKDDRTAIQATQQSKMIDQRQQGGGNIDFKSQNELEKIIGEQQAQKPVTPMMPEEPINPEEIL